MGYRTRILLALVVAMAILVLFVLPAFDVDPTAMRAARAAALLMISIACAAFTFLASKACVSCRLLSPHFRVNTTPDVLEVTCSLLC
jgi:cytochrome c biogenesis factor